MLRDRLGPHMDTGRVLKLAAYYRLLATLSFVVGFGIVGAGVALGVWPMLEHMLNNAPQDFDESIRRAQPVVFVALSAVGLVVWQFGKSFAFVRVISSAAEAGSGGGAVDESAIRSEVGQVVDDRLAAADLSGDADAGSTGDVQERAARRRSATTAATDEATAASATGATDAGGSNYDATDTGGADYDTTAGPDDEYDDAGGTTTEFDTDGADTTTDGDGAGTSGSAAGEESESTGGDTAGTAGGEDPLSAGADDDEDEWRPSN